MISVIIPVYNAEKYIREMASAVLAQTHQDLELILVDDGSADNSGKICDQIAEIDARVQVLHQDNRGSAAARNAGLDCAKGEYIAFFDADDHIDADMLERLLEPFSRYNIDIVSCGYEEVRGEERSVKSCPDKEVFLTPMDAYRELFKAPSGIWSNSNCNKLYRKELFEKIRYREGILGEDIEISARLIEQCRGAVCIPFVLYHYIHREGSNTTGPLSEKRLAILDITPEIVERVQNKYPELIPDAYAYDLLWMIFSWNNINHSTDAGKYRAYKTKIRHRIRDHFREYYNNQCVTGYMKSLMIAMLLHIYEPVVWIGACIGKIIRHK